MSGPVTAPPDAGPAGRGSKARAPGEAATRFRRDAIGRDPLAGRAGGMGLLRGAEGRGGHLRAPARFDARARWRGAQGSAAPAAGSRSPLRRPAPAVGAQERGAVTARLARIGRPRRVGVFGPIGRRGVFTADPEGNTVELVAAFGAQRGDTTL